MMLNLSYIFECVDNEWNINDTTIIYMGRIRIDFFYHYVSLYDNDFYKPLSERVDLMSFAEKIHRLGSVFVIITDNDVAGIVASYFYDTESRKGFITLVHTRYCHRGKHLARYLIEAVKKYAETIDFLYVDLGVYKNNVAAFRLYLSAGFELFTEEGDRCVLRYTLGNISVK